MDPLKTGKKSAYPAAWDRQVRSLSRRLVLADWLERVSVPLVLTSLLSGCALLLLRKSSELNPNVVWITALGLALTISTLLLWRSHADRESDTSLLTRLDCQLGLQNKLAAAQAGLADWPAPPAERRQATQWNWRRVLLPFALSGLFLSAAAFMPISKQTANAEQQQPHSWDELGTELDKLRDSKAVDEPYIEEIEKRLEELRNQSPEDWFSPSSLEATDTLKEQHKQAAEEMKQNLEQAADALEILNNTDASEAQKNQAQQQLSEAMEQLQNGAMQPNQELQNQLQELGEEGARQLSPEQSEQLRKAMEENAQKLQDAQGQGQSGEGDDWMQDMLDGDRSSREGEGEQKSQNGESGPGSGGVDRGPGTDPDVLGDEANRLNLRKFERLEMDDLENSLPGDLLKLENDEHQENSNGGSSTGGAIKGTGQGGSRTFTDDLLPDEQRAVKGFFGE